MTAKALHIKTNGETQVVTLPDENSYQLINELVGGWFDAVRGEEFVLYVNDEGLLIEGMEPNVIASAMTRNVIFGDVVVVGSLNAQGYYDGENHDVPEVVLQHCIAKAHGLNTNEAYRSGLIIERARIMEDPVQVYGQNEDGEWVWV